MDDAYHVWLSKQIAAAIIKAHGNLAPATVAHGSFEQPSFIKCRRFLCEPGTVGANPFGETGERIKSVAGPGGKVLRPAGPVDPQFSVLSFRHADGKPLAVLGNFSVHYCGGYAGGLVSADYFGAYAKALENKLNAGEKHPPFVGLMSNGTSGDTGSIQLNLGKAKPWDRINASGRALAEKTLDSLQGFPMQRPSNLPQSPPTSNSAYASPRPNASSGPRTCWPTAVPRALIGGVGFMPTKPSIWRIIRIAMPCHCKPSASGISPLRQLLVKSSQKPG